ncbi:S-formylglutathione hydrolase FrmB [Brevibacterium sanguinis]|uniref:S-formylglutathione hydrolase FrmB n=2 Tax=Brevibacterium TaxID=1696 RepID=A0A366IFZ3_9MICO|nr:MULTISPECIES: alpha/beta hydrolase family protein [Brevibacterium]RBP63175.1 S-formylglutathione hydrolase FrmB [Brevibacterium sanguinis]RBP69649.1 S-formylglutathione hydrolase FrmB [Brevibacterium celere]
MRRQILLTAGARALRALTLARSRAGRYPARDQNSDFLGPEPRGRDARTWHIRDKRKLSTRLREFFLYSPSLGRTVGVRVLLPGVPQEVSPVIHLYHGGGDDFRSWTDFGAAEELTRTAPYLIVMPDAGAGTYSRVAVGSRVHDWPAFHTVEIPDFLQKTYSVSPEREDRLLAGLSMGGYGAMKYAAWHPDRFGSAAAFSSPLDPLSAIPAFDIIALREGARTLFGDPTAERSEWIANSPYGLAENLADVDVWLSAGSGRMEPKDRDLLEIMVSRQGERFSARLSELGIRHSWFPRTSGLHDWAAWQRELAAWLGALQRRRDYGGTTRRRGARRVPDGGEFTYLTGHPLFEIHGWRVEISRRRAQIVRFDRVSAAGFSLTGTGSFRVRTPALFRPGLLHTVTVTGPSGTDEHSQRADKSGRLTFTGRLAPAMHDPIIPGKRTRHFPTIGQAEVTSVTIAAAEDEEAASTDTSAAGVPKSAHVGDGSRRDSEYSELGAEAESKNSGGSGSMDRR